MTSTEFRSALLKLWQEAYCVMMTPERAEAESFLAWSGATKDLLLDYGLVYDSQKDEYFFKGEAGHEHVELPPRGA